MTEGHLSPCAAGRESSVPALRDGPGWHWERGYGLRFICWHSGGNGRLLEPTPKTLLSLRFPCWDYKLLVFKQRLGRPLMQSSHKVSVGTAGRESGTLQIQIFIAEVLFCKKSRTELLLLCGVVFKQLLQRLNVQVKDA